MINYNVKEYFLQGFHAKFLYFNFILSIMLLCRSSCAIMRNYRKYAQKSLETHYFQ